jgi:hypothetical protein
MRAASHAAILDGREHQSPKKRLPRDSKVRLSCAAPGAGRSRHA